MLTESSIRAPVAVAVGVILVTLFGLVTFFQIPIQLTPNVDKARLTVTTTWPGASPQEVEREIVDQQEEFLKNIEGLQELTSESQDSVGTIVLEFPPGTDMGEAMLRVANRLEQVPQYPELANQPTISSRDPRANASAWLVLKRMPGNTTDIVEYYDLCKDVIKPALERVQGVASSNIFGGAEKELRVTVDPQALSARKITIRQMISALRRENKNTSAGDFDEGKRRYVVRTVAEYSTPQAVLDVVVARRGNKEIYVRDVADVTFGYKDEEVSVRQFGEWAIAMNVQRATGANVLEVMEGVRQVIADMNRDTLPEHRVVLQKVYDETVYIYGAIDLVEQNIIVGGLLAIFVLFIFLRSGRSVFVIAVAIPISVIGTFLVMFLLGRNINVISLAGMSFAVGMVVDNSIVVLENIFRHVQMGKDRWTAAKEGTSEVGGAILASTLTTMAVFLPILFMVDEAGQLFKDIAIAVSSAVALSLLVSITVIPTLSARIMKKRGESSTEAQWATAVNRRIADFVYWLTGTTKRRVVTVLTLLFISLGLARALLPSAEYLPTGNQNLVFAIVLPPPGYNLAELTTMADQIENGLSPHFERFEGKENPNPKSPVMENFFFVAAGRQVFMGAIAKNPEEIQQIIPLFARELTNIPGLYPIVLQLGLFSGLGGGRTIDVEITGPELPKLVELGGRTFGTLLPVLPGAQMQPIPSLDLGNPEVRIKPHRDLTAPLGITAEDLGIAVDVLLDGRKVSDYQHEGREIDLVLRGVDEYVSRSQDFESLPISAENGKLVTLGSVADIEVGTGPEQINHVERDRNITIRVTPPRNIALEDAMTLIRSNLIEPLRRGRRHDPDALLGGVRCRARPIGRRSGQRRRADPGRLPPRVGCGPVSRRRVVRPRRHGTRSGTGGTAG